MEKNKDLKFIREFSKITIKDICEKNNINSSNLWAGRTSKENTNKVKVEIMKRLKKLDQLD